MTFNVFLKGRTYRSSSSYATASDIYFIIRKFIVLVLVRKFFLLVDLNLNKNISWRR